MKFGTVLVASLLLVGAQDLPEVQQRNLDEGRRLHRVFRRGHRGRRRSYTSSSSSSYSSSSCSGSHSRSRSGSRSKKSSSSRSGSHSKKSSSSHSKSRRELKTCHTLCKEDCPKPGEGTGGRRCKQKCDKEYGFYVAKTPAPATKKPTRHP